MQNGQDEPTEQQDQAIWREELLQEATEIQEASEASIEQEPEPKGIGKVRRPKHYLIGRKIHRRLAKASRLKNRKRKHHPAKRKSHK